MVQLIEAIVKPLVDYPDNVQVTETTDGNLVNYALSVNQKDMGKVIGKKGRIAQAIRTVVNAKAHASNERIHLTIVD